MSEPTEPTREQLSRRLERERDARRQAEVIAENATRELYLTLEELRSLNQAMRDFVAVAAHDLRGPVTTISGFAGLLRDEWGTLAEDEKQRFVEVVHRGATNLTGLTEDLLTLSRIESGALDTQMQVVELDAAVREAMQQLLDNPGEIRVNIAPSVRAQADPHHLGRILTNYLNNAIKYGDPPYEIDVMTRDGWVEIRVRDHGGGVPPDFVPRLFARFARADDAAMKGIPGAGLGLSIVMGLAQANGGDVWYEPNEPQGSCFAVRLVAAA
jgi:signal transduction histidine kinase